MKVSRILQTTTFLAAISLYPYRVTGHDGWIEVSPALVEKGQLVTISLFQGNHSNEHRSYRLAGKWRPQDARLMVADPAGQIFDLTGAIVDFGEDEEKIGPKGPKGFHIAQLVAKEQGLYVALARQERIVEDASARLRTLRTARSWFGALLNPTFTNAKELAWPTPQPVLGDGLEIVPITHPLTVTAQSPITLEVHYNEAPPPDRTLTVIRKFGGPASAQDFTTNGQGRVSFTVGPADLYLARIKVDEDGLPTAQGKREKGSYEATFVFQVFNRP